jgi:hypothetical protein
MINNNKNSVWKYFLFRCATENKIKRKEKFVEKRRQLRENFKWFKIIENCKLQKILIRIIEFVRKLKIIVKNYKTIQNREESEKIKNKLKCRAVTQWAPWGHPLI